MDDQASPEYVIEKKVLNWIVPGTSSCAFFLIGAPDFYHLEFSIKMFGDNQVIRTVIGSTSSSVLLIEPLEEKLLSAADTFRYLVASVHNYDVADRDFRLDFLFDGEVKQAYEYNVEGLTSLSIYFPVKMLLPAGPPSLATLLSDVKSTKKGAGSKKSAGS